MTSATSRDSAMARSSGAGTRLTRVLTRDPSIELTLALGLPGILAAIAMGRPDATLAVVGYTAAAGVAQWVLAVATRRWRRLRGRTARMLRLSVASLLALGLSEVALNGSFQFFIPVVGIAAALGDLEGVTFGLVAVALYMAPIALGARDPSTLARGLAGAGVSALVAIGARFIVRQLERASGDLREANLRERRRLRQLQGIERVGRALAAGPSQALDQVVELLVERFGYQQVSIYLARPDGVLELGAQRGYDTPFQTFDGTTGVFGRVMHSRTAELVADVSSDPDYASANAYVVSEICAPLVVGDELLGIVNVESVGRILDRADLQLVVTLADQVAAYVALGRERARLAEEAVHDALTGLHNRRYLDEAIERLFAGRARTKPDRREPIAVILFDFDHFGEINKRYGLAIADDVLRRFGALLGGAFRDGDLVARYGGEEFLVVLVGSSLEDAQHRADDIRATVADHFLPDGPDVTVSGGCAALPPDNPGAWRELRESADVAVNMAKRAGRNQVVGAIVPTPEAASEPSSGAATEPAAEAVAGWV